MIRGRVTVPSLACSSIQSKQTFHDYKHRIIK